MTSISSSLTLQAERLRRTPWLDIIGKAWLTFVGGMFVWLVLPAWLAHALRPLLLLAPLLVLVAKDLSHFPDAVQRSRDALRMGAWRKLPAAWLPPELLGLFRIDRALRRGFLGWAMRRPQPAPPAGRAFSYLERGAYRTGIAIVLVSCFLEIPLDAFVLPFFIHDPAELRLIHVLLLVAGLANLVWVFGDRWLIGSGQHVLTEEGLALRVGARTHGLVPLDAVARCERIAEPMDKWLRRNGIERCRAIKASPLDSPNTVLILKADSRVRLTHLGVERSGLACIFLYVDRPQDLVQALTAG